MKSISKWLTVARDEIETLQIYFSLLEEEGEMKEPARLDEIIGDEFNHAMISLFTAASESGIKIPTDGINEAIAGILFNGEEIPEELEEEAGEGNSGALKEDESKK